MFHGRSHHQEGHSDTDGYEHLDQLSHPGERLVTFIYNLHGLVGRVMDDGDVENEDTKEEGHTFYIL